VGGAAGGPEIGASGGFEDGVEVAFGVLVEALFVFA